MSIFDSIKNAIFGTRVSAPTPVPTPSVARDSGQGKVAPPPDAPPVAPADRNTKSPPTGSPAGAGPVDIEAALNARLAAKHEKLNWQSSIVDLMKLVDLDSSLENRKSLAKELGYSGDMQDSASMNIWLHKEVMRRLAASGGKVPDSLRQ